MRDDIFDDDIFEEDIFEEDVFNEEAVVSPAKTEEEEEAEYVVGLLKQGAYWIEEVVRGIDKIIDINDKFTEEIPDSFTYKIEDLLNASYITTYVKPAWRSEIKIGVIDPTSEMYDKLDDNEQYIYQ